MKIRRLVVRRNGPRPTPWRLLFQRHDPYCCRTVWEVFIGPYHLMWMDA